MKIEKNLEYNFLVITPEENMVMTNWDKKDVKNYSSSTLMYTPTNFDSTQYYEISKEEDEKLKAEQRALYEKEEAERRK